MLAIKNLTDNFNIYRHSAMLMGTRFEITVTGDNPAHAQACIDNAVKEINRVEKLLSAFGDDSNINQVNRHAGVQPVKVNAELYKLIERSTQIAQLTNGAFDITYTTADNPASAVNYTDIVLDAAGQTVFLKKVGMRISFAANCKGYAADRAKYILQLQGISSGVINAGGDLLTWGLQPDNEPWTVAAADPDQSTLPYAHINISNMAIAASKNIYANNNNGKKASVIRGISVISPVAELADAMATPLINAGIDKALNWVNSLNQIACIIIDGNNHMHASKGINIA